MRTFHVRSIGMLALATLFASVAPSLGRSSSRAQAPAAKGAGVAKLQEERISVLRQAAQHASKTYAFGMGTVADVTRYSHMLLDAELETSQSAKQRVDLLQTALTAARDAEERTEKMFAAGRLSNLVRLEAQINRLDIEIRLAKARAAVDGDGHE